MIDETIIFSSISVTGMHKSNNRLSYSHVITHSIYNERPICVYTVQTYKLQVLNLSTE